MSEEDKKQRVGVSYGPASELYSFPGGHPLNNSRTKLFAESLKESAVSSSAKFSIVEPIKGQEDDLLKFHTKEYVEFVKESSVSGQGYLDYGDTPSFKGVFEASLYTVGSSVFGLEQIVAGEYDHFFNPVGGLHHARKDRAGGFCVFDDCAIAISKALNDYGVKQVAYVDIDAHHGDGVYYGFENDPRIIIGDIHEDGRYLYPGTGTANETGKGEARGTKLNIPLSPGSGDKEFFEAFDAVFEFIESARPEFIFFQCGADGLRGDPLTHLSYSARAHVYASRKLHDLSHDVCDGRLLAMGGGGYNADNVRDAWMGVINELSTCNR